MNQNLRVAWLLPVAWYYWQPGLIEFSKYFPKTKIFTGLFPGLFKGCQDSLDVEVVGKFQPIGSKKGKSYGSGITYLSPQIINYLLRFKPQVIFSSSFGIWTIIALLLKPWQKWQVIIAYEGSSPGVDFRNSALRLLIRQTMVKAADGFITNSGRGKEYLINILQAPSGLVFAHPYEIPPLELISQESEEQKIDLDKYTRPIFLFVGRIIPRKGIDILLQACLKLNQEKKTDYTVVIVGDGEQRKDLETFCEKHNLQNNVKWTGRVQYDQINDYYKSADVFILPTWEDTWGVVVLEVMLFGKPVICSTGAGSSELVIDGENGYVFAPHQPDKLAELMSKFMDNPSLIQKMGIKSQEKMKQYSPQAAGIFLKDTLDSCLTKNI